MNELLRRISKEGILIDVENGELQLFSSKTDLDRGLLSEIKEKKQELIAHLLRHKKSDTKKAAYQEIPVAEKQESYVLSNAQLRLWLASQSEESSAANNVPNSIVLDGSYDVNSFVKAVHAVIKRHEILRTVFKQNKKSEIRQHILSPEALNFTVDYADLREAENAKEEVNGFIRTDSVKPFDLVNGPLLRACLMQVSDDQYVFYYNMHHIISDGWSMGVLTRDIMAFYNAYIAKQDPDVAPLRIQYKDYAVWQVNQLESEASNEHKAYWENKLSGSIPKLTLPSTISRPRLKTFNGKRIGTGISSETVTRLKKFTTKRGGSLFSGLLTAMNVLLYRYTREKDIILGNAAAGRDHADLEDQIGFYINTLALRNSVEEALSFEKLYEQTKKGIAEAYAHQMYPFDKLLEDLNIKRDPDRSPLFDILLDYNGTSEKGITYESDRSFQDFGEGNLKFDLEIDFTEVAGGVNLKIGFNTDVYEQSVIERFILHYKQLLEAVLLEPGKAVGMVDFLAEDEREKLLNTFSTGESVATEHQDLVTMFAAQAKAVPQSTAIICEGEELTYQQLDERSNRLAHLLAERGVETDTLVPLCMDRSLDMFVAILGILKAGGAYVPVDPSYPQQRLDFIFEDTECAYMLSDSDLSHIYEDYEDEIDVICLDELAEELESYPSSAPEVSIDGDQLAYLIYTSGTTGTPKGVMIEHRSIAGYLTTQSAYFGVDRADTFILFANIAFDASVEQVFLGLVNGARLVVPRKADLLDSQKFTRLLADYRVTHLHAVPSFLRALVIDSAFSLKRIVSAGESFDRELYKEWEGKVAIYNKYGPTEATVSATEYKVTADSYLPLSIGKPIGDTRVYILNEMDALQPEGAIGEICIGGPGLSRGYLNREELTADRFIDNPFAEGKKLYRSGDLGSWLADGSIAFHGRKDHQVKVRGYRIELEEIESVLNELYNIDQAAVLAVDDHTGSRQLVAYVVSNELVDANSIKEGLTVVLEENLPEYMIPDLFIKLEEMPLTASGKIDRKALPVPQTLYRQKDYVAPSTETEEKLAGIWQELLGVDKIGVNDNFFELGGNSLNTLRLIGLYNKAFNKEITFQDVFENPVLSRHVNLLEDSREKDFVGIPAVAEALSYPLSNSQTRLWLASQIEEASVAYNMPKTITLDGLEDRQSFEKAIHATIERHEILRTVFRLNENDEIRQHILSPEELNIDILYKDLRGTEDPRTSQVQFISADAVKSFDLAEGPLLRAALLQVDEQRYVFYYNMHHIISDGWSMDILGRDVMEYYQAFISGREPNLNPLCIQYKDYAAWQLEQIESGSYEAHRAYWVEKFNTTAPVIDLPAYRQRPAMKTYNGHSLGFHVPSELTTGLRGFTTEKGGSLFTGLLSVWNVLLYRFTGTTDITIGNPVAGREHIDLEDQIGFYVNPLPLRHTINPEASFTEVYEAIKSNTLKAYEYQAYPFDRLVDELNLQRDTSRSPLFDVLIDFHGHTAGSVSFGSDSVRDLGPVKVKFDLELHMTEVEGGLNISAVYNADLYEKHTIESLLLHYKELLGSLLADPSQAVGVAGILLAEEKRQLAEWNATEKQYPQKTVLDMFEEQAALTPNTPAVTYDDRQLSYLELSVRSGQLADCLQREHNIATGDLIGVHLNRNIDYIVSVLGILKAGASYVPIDVAYPSERKQYISEDSGISLMVTDTNYMFEMDYYKGGIFAIDVEFEADQYNSVVSRASIPDLAYVIYTSGSTGKPKGVQISHNSFANYIMWGKDHYLTEGLSNTSFGLFTSPSFDLTITSMFLPLISGGTLQIFEEEQDTFYILEQYVKEGMSCIKLTPSHITLLKDADVSQVSLQMAIVGGEELKPSHVSILRSLNPHMRIYNEYGPTEATVGCVVYEVDQAGENIYIGKPIANTAIRVLSNEGQQVPLEVTGEICIGGAGLSKGYINRPELTEEKFIENAVSERLYKTGDMGRWLPEGELDYQGRKDAQVKVRGYRIELGEIETVLSAIPGVGDAVVEAPGDSNGTRQLVAYIVAEGEADEEQIQRDLGRQLPEYMVPKRYLFMDKLPLTTNGKVDRKALPHPDEAAISNHQYVEPETDEEKALVAAWKAVLKQEVIGAGDNFYNLGGDSIKSIQIVTKLRESGFTLKVGDILSNPDLSKMALLMKKVSRTIDQAEVEGNVPLTPIQHYFFHNEGIKNKKHYNQSVLLKSSGKLDTEMLDECMAKLVQHHDALRMRYRQDADGWEQYNEKFLENSYRIDFHDMTEETHGLKKMSEMAGALQQGFDLENGPLMVAGHFRLKDGDRLALICHHLVTDGVSWRILLEDLSTLFSQKLNNEPLALPLKTDSFKKWSEGLSRYAQTEASSRERHYWTTLLAKKVPPFPTDNMVEGGSLKHDKQSSFVLDKTLTKLMQTKTYEVYHTEINDLLLTGLGLAIKEVFGITRCVLEMEGHGREDILNNMDISRTVGWFTSLYPVVLEVSENEDIAPSLVAVKDNLRKIPNKGIGYGITKYLSDDFTSDLKPAIQFNYLGDIGGESQNSGDGHEALFKLSSEYIGSATSEDISRKTPLSISGMLVGGELKMTLDYSSALFSDVTIEKLNEAYKEKLSAVICELAREEGSFKTPSDLTFKELTFEEVQKLDADGNLSDVYELSPTQQGMYFHWLSSNEAYFEQIAYRIKGEGINIASFQKAYGKLLDRYGILRTYFTDEYSNRILQVIEKSVEPKFEHKLLPAGSTEQELEAWVAEQKRQDVSAGFNLSDPSQMRLTILELGDQRYEFIWSHHHILMDGWCTSILLNDFHRILQAVDNNVSISLPEPAPYVNYIEWLQNINEQQSLLYWKEFLSGYDSVAKVPFAKSKRTNQEYNNTKEHIQVTGEVFEKVNKLCHDTAVTLNTFVQAAWGVLIAKYNDTKDVVFGSVVSGRPAELEGIEDMVGLFLNTIPVRVQYNESDAAEDLLKKCQEDAIASLPHHYTSLASVQGQSELGSALLDHILIFENYPVQEMVEEQLDEKEKGSPIVLESVDVREQTNYGFNISVGASDTILKVQFEYDKNQYDQALIRHMFVHLENIIKGFVNDPAQTIDQIEYLTEGEKLQLTESFNPVVTDFSAENSVLELFARQAQSTPENIALVYEESTMTYRELERRSSQLARYLIGKEVGQGKLVAICMEKSIETVVAIVAVMKTGAGYIPVDIQSPENHIRHIIQDSGAFCCLISERINSEVFRDMIGEDKTLKIDVGLSIASEESYEAVDVQVSPVDTAYVIFTSGSTGKPKGVEVTHGNLLNISLSWKEDYGLNSEVSLLQMANISFDVFTGDLMRGLLFGGKVILCPLAIRLDFMKLYELIARWKVNMLETTPALAVALFDYIYENELDISYMDLLILGSDICPATDYQRLIRRYGTMMRIINSYGTTETTIDSSYFETKDAEVLEEMAYVPIGKPMHNTTYYVLDNNRRLLPAGVAGELYIGGAGVAKRYLNRPELTAEKFVAHPFSNGDILYKTGDLAKWLPDGNMDFIGRKDFQVKIRGYRVELGEVEATLDEIAGIQQAVVIAHKDNTGNMHLVAYLVNEGVEDQNSIQKILESKLPEYMVPRLYMFLEKMPISLNGKIDRKALPAPVIEYSSEKYVAPTTDTEAKMASIWSEILGIEKIGIHDDFFTLGGNSLNAIKVILRIRKEMNIEVAVQNMFNMRTISDIATHVDFTLRQKELKSKGKIVKQIL
ncbi:amino acid adenylation domain-containing protein [Roseivirga sp. BDSF3-8]|uniref:amino acid adenylation domain-containing protein n=1 Tax=Roseivirga sp. BDSF3-8 TaxID=3241598 RepID=UPI003532495A